MNPTKLTREQARCAVLASQGIGTSKGPLVDAISKTGFVRTLGGVEVYLAARARVAGMKAKDLDQAVADRKLAVVPTVRGCIYLVAAKDVPVSLRVADLLSRERSQKEWAKAGIKKGEIEKLADLVERTLKQTGALTTDALRKTLPEEAVRSLGEKGKKAGISSPLPPALRQLEFAGRVERVLDTGRLDSERYRWRVPIKSPFAGVTLPDNLADLAPKLVEIFLGAAGIARVEDFQCWSGLSKRDALKGFAETHTIPLTVEGYRDEWFSLATTYADDAPSCDDVHAFLGFEDNVLALNTGTELFADPVFHSMKVPAWGTPSKVKLGEARHLFSRPVISEGRLVGFWDYDPKKREAVYGLFEAVSPASKKKLNAEAEAVGAFLRVELGHGRSFSLDTDEALGKRVEEVKKLVAKPAPKRRLPKAAKTAKRAKPKK